MLEDGYMTVKVKTPCMITCIKELNQPRYLSVGGAFDAYSDLLHAPSEGRGHDARGR